MYIEQINKPTFGVTFGFYSVVCNLQSTLFNKNLLNYRMSNRFINNLYFGIGNKNMKNLTLTILSFFLLASCVSPKVVKTVQISDKDLSCTQLIVATEEAKKFEEDGREGRTVNGTNVAAAIFFWPGLIATYMNTDDAIDAAKDRQEYLAKIYDKKCSENPEENSVIKSIEKDLDNLKKMYSKGLITDEEYAAARKKALGL